ncbi:MAG: cellulase family glycosylhydrolase [Proteobacteria bacterium]|nr:cellulase family glycosylhydrolase [Pseudomonadota bacterium]
MQSSESMGQSSFSRSMPVKAIQPGGVSVTASPMLLPAGYLSTNGNQIVDAAGAPVRIASVGWNQNFTNIPGTVAAMVAAGFNTIRLDWVDATLFQANPVDSINLATIKQIVAAAGADGMKVILDHHTDEAGTAGDGYGAQQQNGLWYDLGPGTNNTNGVGVTGTVTQAQFQADWVTVAKAFAGNSTVIGYDLANEPLMYGSAGATGVTWGKYTATGTNNGVVGGPTDIHAMYQTVGNAIQAVDPGALIIAEGPQNYGGNFAGTGTAPEGDLSVAAKAPVVLNDPNKVVYSVHEYPTEISNIPVDSGAAAVTRMNQAWGYLESTNTAPVWVGEMGSSMITANSQAWASTMTAYMNGHDAAQGGPVFTGRQQPVGGDWWVWGYLPGEAPDGTLNANGSLNAAQKAVWSQLLPMTCFAAGTRIMTLRGEIAVERLEIGEVVICANGRTAPVCWVGRRTVDLARHPTPERANPIRFEPGSIADGVPRRALLLSPDHALLLDGHLIPAKALVNGATIRMTTPRSVTYYHVELPAHSALFAEGTPAESYLDTGNRGVFENGDAPLVLHGLFDQARRVANGCAPFAEAGPVVEELRRRLLDRAAIVTTADAAVEVRYCAAGAVICSRSAVPGELTPDPRDRRRLGVKIAGIAVGGVAIAIDQPSLTDGWHAMEADGRWTDGAAVIPAALLEGRCDVKVTIVASLAYPVEARALDTVCVA